MRRQLSTAVIVSVASYSSAGASADMELARAACIEFASRHLKRSHSELRFAKVTNVSSDPTPDAFEFIWNRNEILGFNGNATPRKGVDGVWCRGFASKRVITFLRVEGDELIASPQFY